MPYNFEATFTKPLIARLDAGEFKDARDWANAITDLYIATITQGLPNGVASTLPAPGLNPGGPPPPFPIGATGFTTATSRKKQMYNIVYAYFFAKELTIEKSQIEAIIGSTKMLIKRAKALQRRIASLKQQAIRLERELKTLPTILSDAYKEIKRLVNQQIEDLDNLVESIRKNEFGSISQQEFESIFRKEINLINRFKQFDVSSPETVVALTRFVAEQIRDNERVLKSPKRDTLIKRNLRNKLFSLSKQTLAYLEVPISPSKAIDFVNNLRRQSAKFTRLAEKVAQLDAIERFVKPKYLKIKAQIKRFLKEQRVKIQGKLKAMSEARKKKVEDRKKRRQESKQQQVYSNAAETIKEEKDRNNTFIKRAKRTIKGLVKILKKCLRLGGKLATLIAFLIREFESIKQKVIATKAKAINLRDRTVAAYNQFASSSLDEVFTTPGESIGSIQVEADQSAAQQAVSAAQQGSAEVSAAAKRVEELRKKDAEDQVAEVVSYFVQAGFKQLANSAASIIRETLCSAKDIKMLFERKKDVYKQYRLEILNLKKDVDDIKLEINKLFTTEEGRNRREKRRAERQLKREESKANQRLRTRDGERSWISNQLTSLKDLFVTLYRFVKPPIERVVLWVKSKLKQLKNWVARTLTKYGKKLENLALSLVPLKSEVRNSIDKKDILEAKKNALQDYKNSIKFWTGRLKTLRKMALGTLRFTANMENGKIGFVDNQQAFNLILDGRFEYQTYDPENKRVSVDRKFQMAQQLIKDKENVGTLAIIETIVRLLATIGKSVAQGEAKRQKDLFFSELGELIESLDPEKQKTYQFIKGLIDSPPEKPNFNDLRAIANTGINSLLEDKRVITRFVAFEKKNLRKVTQVFNSLLENQLVKDRYEQVKTGIMQGTVVPVGFTGLVPQDTTRLSKRGTLLFTAVASLYKLRDSMSKNESFVLKLVKILSDLVTKFLRWLAKQVNTFLKKAAAFIKAKLTKERDKHIQRERDRTKKRMNLEAAAMSVMFDLAARAFWTNAQWIGTTGSQHRTLTVGPFAPKMQAKIEDGATGLVSQMAAGFETQLKTMQGFVSPPANTGIPPLAFVGYS
jgi:hypothetical protein